MSEAGVIRFLSQILAFSLTQDLENLLEPEMRKKYWGYVMDTATTMELASLSISLIETGQGKTFSRDNSYCLVDTYSISMLIVINLYNKYNHYSFNSILDIYRTGVLHLNTDLCALVLQKDLEYWQIDELILGMMPKYKNTNSNISFKLKPKYNIIYILVTL